MKCPKCQTENPDTAKFCVECGNKLEISCSQCGFSNLLGIDYCRSSELIKSS
ncbi:MAG: zinc ribbon domain-containing protein [Deltaproteobacteria bacterium]|nr:zinc ribbon domain-containing protein [Deltaproteobacteria bacterium]